LKFRLLPNNQKIGRSEVQETTDEEREIRLLYIYLSILTPLLELLMFRCSDVLVLGVSSEVPNPPLVPRTSYDIDPPIEVDERKAEWR
jgi:hypothetical protein